MNSVIDRTVLITGGTGALGGAVTKRELRPVNAAFVRSMGTELITVRIDLDD